MDFSSKDLLLDDRLAPITNAMGFFEEQCDIIAGDFNDWRLEIDSPREVTVSVRPLAGSLETVIRSMLPLRVGGSNRFLFIPTACSWTGYFSNGYRGTDPSAVRYMARRHKTRSIFVAATPHAIRGAGKQRRGRQGDLIFEVYGPEKTDWLNRVRTIRLYSDVGKWHFEQSGEPFPFEETDRYRKRRLLDRFTFNMYKRYMAEFGIHPFDEDFYLPDPEEQAVLIELSGNLPAVEKDISLEEARRLNGIEG